MQQRFRRLALFVGASALVGAGLIVAACGTDNGSTPVPTPGVDGGGKDSSKTDGSTTDPDGSTDPDAANAPDCANEPKLRTNTTTSGIYCAFYKRDGGAVEGGLGTSYCENDDTCCNPADVTAGTHELSYCAQGKGGDKCAAQAAANSSVWTADAGSSWECSDKNSCSAGQVCCLMQDQAKLALDPAKNKLNIGTFGKNNPNSPPACNGHAAYNAGGTRCTTGTTCGAGEYKLCSLSDDNCGAGTKCIAIEAFFRDLGYCGPM